MAERIAARRVTTVELLLQRPTFRMRGGRSGDSRDWQAIDSWTDEIVRRLSTSGSVR